jgi:predicted dehydrogenase
MIQTGKIPARKLKLAILGGGVNSTVGGAHRNAIELGQAFEITAGCFSRKAAVNLETARLYRVPEEKTYSSYDDLLEGEAGNLDAIAILTPTRQHKDQVIKAFEAGIPVICEKALAGSVSEIDEIWRAGSDASFLAVTLNYTGYPMLREIKSMVQKGVFGALHQIHIEMPQEGFLRRNADDTPITPQYWRLTDGPVPTLSLDLGVHVHSLLHFLTGKSPVEVSATSQSYGNFPQIVDNVSALVSCEDGLHCNVWYGKTALGQRNGLRVRLYGEKASVEWAQENPEVVQFADNKGRRMTIDRSSPDTTVANQKRYGRAGAGHSAGFVEALSNYYDDVASALHQREEKATSWPNPYILGLPESREGLELVEAIERSRRERRWVNLRASAVSRTADTETLPITVPGDVEETQAVHALA